MKVTVNGNPPTTIDYPSPVIPETLHSRVKGGNPAWKEVIRSGGSATNPYSISRNTFQPGAPSRVTRSNRATGYMYDWCNAPSLPHGNFNNSMTKADYQSRINQLKANSILKLYSDIGEKFQAVSTATLSGELLETIRMVKHPLKTMREHLAKGLKKYNSFKKSSPKAAASFWLEWNFGWVPAASTVYDILEHRSANTTFARFQSTEKIRLHQTNRVTNGFYTFQYDELNHDQIDISVRTIACVHLNARGPSLLALEYGLHFEDLAPTAWELMPWSFAFDYFFDIGKYLEAQKWATLTTPRYALQNVKIQAVRRCFAIPNPNSFYNISISSREAGIQKFEFFERSPILLKPPSLSTLVSPKISVKQGLNLSALAILGMKYRR
jgi:hypothetical protein